jgi:hypothetical protein
VRCRIVTVDVGAVRKKNFAWAALDLPTRSPFAQGGMDPEGAALSVLDAFANSVPVALGFEAPMMVPVSPMEAKGWQTLGKARQGEVTNGQSRPWSAGAGSGALATGLVQMAWVLERVAMASPHVRCTTQPELWLAKVADLPLWEAFVSGSAKPAPSGMSQHAADAAAAADTFATRLEESNLLLSDVTCEPSTAFNLAAAAAIYSSMSIATAEIRLLLKVYRTQPADNPIR